MQRPKIMHARGFTITELVVVVAIIAILLAIIGISAKPWMDKYKVESQIRMMHADIIQARAQAMQRNLQYWVAVNAGSYQIIEDTDGDGTLDPSPTDTYMWQTPKTLNYLVTGGTGTLILDTRGIISTTTSSVIGTLSIQFDTRSSGALYDCLQVQATRINVGRVNGTSCAPQ